MAQRPMRIALNKNQVVVTMERPIEVREYEFEWFFDKSIVRFSIQGHPAHGNLQFASLLKAIESEYGPLLLEGDELCESGNTIETLIQKKIYTFDPVSEPNHKEHSAELLRTSIIKYYGISYAFTVDASLIECVLIHLNATEWWGSFWGVGRPYSFLSAAYAFGSSRVEPIILSSIEDCSPVFFLAPNHCHLELMLKNDQADRLLEILYSSFK